MDFEHFTMNILISVSVLARELLSTNPVPVSEYNNKRSLWKIKVSGKLTDRQLRSVW